MPEYYKNIPSEDMTDFEDFYIKVAELLPDECRVAEIGCGDGRSAIFLAETLLEMNKKFHLTMVDNMDYGRNEQRNIIINHLIKSNMGGYMKLVEMDSLLASCKIPDGHFHFVFIDSSHEYEKTKAEIRLWYRKVMDEGIIAGHDYFLHKGVQLAVNEVIPEEILQIEDTRRNSGVWWIKKEVGLVLK